MLNKVTLIGNLGRDPEIRHFEGGSQVAKFSLATNENFKDRNGEWQTRTEWHDIVCWGALAERVERTLKKGQLVYVEGKISTRKWQDKDGNDRYTTEVVSNLVKSLERRESGNTAIADTGFPSIEDKFETTSQKTPESQTASVDDDLPF